MSEYFIQDYGSSKGMIVKIIETDKFKIKLECVKDKFQFIVSKGDFNEFYIPK